MFLFKRNSLSGLLLLALLSFLAVPGCGKSEPPPDVQLDMEGIAKWYSLYRENHKKKAPADEAAFVAFIQKRLAERGDSIDPATFLVSKRDGKPFVIAYGKPTANSAEKNVAVREQEGYEGKKMIAFELGYAYEVEEAELQTLLSAK